MFHFLSALTLSVLVTTFYPADPLPAPGPRAQVSASDASATPPDDLINDRVSARSSTAYSVFLTRGDWTLILGKGDGTTDLDLTIYDPSGDLVGWDYRFGDEMEAAFAPPKTGYYRVQITNLGRVWNDFALGVW